MGQLLEGVGKFLKGFSKELCPHFELTAIIAGQVLVPEEVLSGFKYTFICHFFRGFV